MSDKALMIGGVVVLVCCCASSIGAVMMSDGDDTKSPGPSRRSPGPSGRTTFGSSTLPTATEATIVEPGYEWVIGQEIKPPNDSYSMILQDDNNLCINGAGGAKGCLMSHTVGGTAKVYFQDDGNICVRNQANMNDAKCYMSHNNDVPDGQHRLVLHNDGKVYVDHGTGESGRFDLVRFF